MRRGFLVLVCIWWVSLFFCHPSSTAADKHFEAALALNKQGENLLESSRYEEALAVFMQMLTSCGDHDFCRGVAEFWIGRAYNELGQHDGALKSFDRAESIFKKLGKQDQLGMVLSGKGNAYAGLSRYEDALRLFDGAQKLFTHTHNDKELFAVYNSVAVVHVYRGDYDEAASLLDRAQRLVQSPDNLKLLAPLRNNMGLLHARRMQHDEALNDYNQALKYYKSLRDLKGMSITLTNIGQVYEARSEYSKALDYHMKSLELARKGADLWCETLALNNIGWVELKRGNYEAAYRSYEDSYKKRIERGMLHFASETLNNMGIVQLAYANYPKATECFEKSLDICDKVGSASCRAWVLHNLAYVFKDTGKFKESLAASLAAIEIAQKIGDRRMEATAVLRLGNLYEYQGWYDRALEQYERAAAIQEEISDLNFRANTLADIAGILTRRGEPDEAAKYYEKAREVKRKIGAPYADVLCKAALSLIEADKYAPNDTLEKKTSKESKKDTSAQASSNIQEAEKVVKTGQKLDLMLLTYVKGRFFLEKDPQESLKHFENLKSLADSAAVRKFAFLASVGMGLAQEMLQNWSEAEKSFRQAVEYAEQIRQTLDPYARITFLDGEEILGLKHVAPYEGLARVHMRKGEKEESLMWAEFTKARAFSEALAARNPATSHDVPPDVLDRDATLNNRMAGLMKGLETAYQQGAHKAVDELELEIRSLSKERQHHIDRLREKFPLFAATKYPAPMKLGQTDLKDNEWTLVYDLTDSGLLVYLLHGRTIVKADFKPVSRKYVDSLVRRFREPLEIVPGRDAPEEKLLQFDFASGKSLSDLLTADLLPYLPVGAPLIVVPDDSLGEFKMERGRFLFQTLVGSLSLFFFGPGAAEAKEEDDFTMSSGPLVGGANATGGA